MGNIFIYGGCVTRDTYEHLVGHTLLEYVARQSLISANSPATKMLGAGELASPFQSRSLNGDVDSVLFSKVRSRSSEVDLVLVDLLSERLGVFALPDKTYITHSVELKKSGRLGDLRPPLVKFGTDKHFHLWRRGMLKFARVLESRGLLGKTLVFDTPWAEFTDSGEEVPLFRNISAVEAGLLYVRYYSFIEELGIRVVRLPVELAISTESHKWGVAPYHYIESAYLWMRDRVYENV